MHSEKLFHLFQGEEAFSLNMRREDESLVQIFYSSQSKMIFCVREEGKRFERKRL